MKIGLSANEPGIKSATEKKIHGHQQCIWLKKLQQPKCNCC